VLAEYRGRGLFKWLMQCVMSHPELQGLRRWILLAGDAHGLYAQSGFTSLAEADRWMQRHAPAVYLPKD
jgi:predicted N-acetyltransferase YhbS